MLKVEFEHDEECECYELIITHNGKEIGRYHDGMEPEDATFMRDLSWIDGAIENAYKLGIQDGIEDGRCDEVCGNE